MMPNCCHVTQVSVSNATQYFGIWNTHFLEKRIFYSAHVRKLSYGHVRQKFLTGAESLSYMGQGRNTIVCMHIWSKSFLEKECRQEAMLLPKESA